MDKGGRDVALRPEMTPTFARMVAARANALRKPVRWFSLPQLFRYERQQRGRLREHFQLNMDIIGEADVLADAELLAVAIDIMRAAADSRPTTCARASAIAACSTRCCSAADTRRRSARRCMRCSTSSSAIRATCRREAAEAGVAAPQVTRCSILADSDGSIQRRSCGTCAAPCAET